MSHAIPPRVDLNQSAPELTRQLGDAAIRLGCVQVTGHDLNSATLYAARKCLREWFALGEAQKHALATQRFNPASANRYRGYFPSLSKAGEIKEGFEVGRERSLSQGHPSDPFQEPNVWPTAVANPSEWRLQVLNCFAEMERLARRVMQHLAEYLGDDGRDLDTALEQGNSTLRLMHYRVQGDHAGDVTSPVRISTGAHVDSPLLTLLWQSSVGGLQVQDARGEWHHVASDERQVTINVGALAERWSQGRLRGVPHRVIETSQPRQPIAFFLEPRVDAVIGFAASSEKEEPADRLAPVRYGDYLREKIAAFAEYQDTPA